ncbi:MAG: hypothetical protein PVH61_06920 [Candidatus Aminicenantes bacterium]|jgi:hypothetical protein
MNYFLRELRSGNLKYWVVMVFVAAWFVALIDIFGAAFGSSGVMGGRWFYATLILTILAPVAYFVHDFTTRSKKKKKTKAVEQKAELFEPRREKEIRRILEVNPEFVTLCYECIHFNPELRVCARKFSDDVSYQRVKEVKINNKSYCLYWVDATKKS